MENQAFLSIKKDLKEMGQSWRRYIPVAAMILLNQLIFLLGVWLGMSMLPAAYPSVTQDDQAFGLLLSSHYRWDALHYLTIAKEGYQAPSDEGIGKLPAFFPLFPLGVRMTAALFGNRGVATYAWSGIFFNLLVCLGAFIIIYNLAERAGFDRQTIMRAILFLAIFPLAVFLAIPYTEALFLFLSAAFFWCVQKRKWLFAGVISGLLTATRVTGVIFPTLLALQLFVLLIRKDLEKKEGLHGISAFVLSFFGLIAYLIYLKVTFNDPLAFLSAQKIWGRELTFPLTALWRGLVYAFVPNKTEFFDQYLVNTIHTGFVVFVMIVMLASIRKWNWLYQVYAWLLLALTLVSPSQGSATMLSTARFMMVLFPVSFTLAEWGKRAHMR